MIKMFSVDSGFLAKTNKDVFVVKIRNETQSVNCFLSDEEVRELKTLCEYHLRIKTGE